MKYFCKIKAFTWLVVEIYRPWRTLSSLHPYCKDIWPSQNTFGMTMQIAKSVVTYGSWILMRVHKITPFGDIYCFLLIEKIPPMAFKYHFIDDWRGFDVFFLSILSIGFVLLKYVKVRKSTDRINIINPKFFTTLKQRVFYSAISVWS